MLPGRVEQGWPEDTCSLNGFRVLFSLVHTLHTICGLCAKEKPEWGMLQDGRCWVLVLTSSFRFVA